MRWMFKGSESVGGGGTRKVGDDDLTNMPAHDHGMEMLDRAGKEHSEPGKNLILLHGLGSPHPPSTGEPMEVAVTLVSFGEPDWHFLLYQTL